MKSVFQGARSLNKQHSTAKITQNHFGKFFSASHLKVSKPLKINYKQNTLFKNQLKGLNTNQNLLFSTVQKAPAHKSALPITNVPKISNLRSKVSPLGFRAHNKLASAFAGIEFEEPLTSRINTTASSLSTSTRGFQTFKSGGKALSYRMGEQQLSFGPKKKVLLPAGLTASSLKSSSLSLAGAARTATSERPVSPHLTIYKFPFAAWTSITTRITGVMLSAGFLDLAFAGLTDPAAITSTVAAIKASSILLPLTKFAVSFPIIYHSLAGIRHIVWDEYAYGLGLPQVVSSGQAIVGASVGLSLLASVVSF